MADNEQDKNLKIDNQSPGKIKVKKGEGTSESKSGDTLDLTPNQHKETTLENKDSKIKIGADLKVKQSGNSKDTLENAKLEFDPNQEIPVDLPVPSDIPIPDPPPIPIPTNKTEPGSEPKTQKPAPSRIESENPEEPSAQNPADIVEPTSQTPDSKPADKPSPSDPTPETQEAISPSQNPKTQTQEKPTNPSPSDPSEPISTSQKSTQPRGPKMTKEARDQIYSKPTNIPPSSATTDSPQTITDQIKQSHLSESQTNPTSSTLESEPENQKQDEDEQTEVDEKPAETQTKSKPRSRLAAQAARKAKQPIKEKARQVAQRAKAALKHKAKKALKKTAKKAVKGVAKKAATRGAALLLTNPLTNPFFWAAVGIILIIFLIIFSVKALCEGEFRDEGWTAWTAEIGVTLSGFCKDTDNGTSSSTNITTNQPNISPPTSPTTPSDACSDLSAVRQASSDNGVGQDLIMSIGQTESGWDPSATSPAGAQGLMQILPDTWDLYSCSGDPYNSTDSINCGSTILSDLQTRAQDNSNCTGRISECVAAGFNGGPGALSDSEDCTDMMKWECQWNDPDHTIPNTGYQETRDYVQRIQDIIDDHPALTCNI